MKKGISLHKSRITTNDLMDGTSIEEQMRKALEGKEPIKATAKINYTERKDGVLPQFDIRTDRFEMALLATDKVAKSNAAARHFADHPELYQRNEDGTPILDPKGNFIRIEE